MYGEVPPLTDAVAVPLLLLQDAGVLLIVTTGVFALEDIVTVSEIEHPFASVIVTIQLPAVSPVAVEVLCPLHHVYVYGGVPPVVLAVAVPPWVQF